MGPGGFLAVLAGGALAWALVAAVEGAAACVALGSRPGEPPPWLRPSAGRAVARSEKGYATPASDVGCNVGQVPIVIFCRLTCGRPTSCPDVVPVSRHATMRECMIRTRRVPPREKEFAK